MTPEEMYKHLLYERGDSSFSFLNGPEIEYYIAESVDYKIDVYWADRLNEK